MSELRWILVVFGIALLAGIYVWGRRGNKQSAGTEEVPRRVRPEPHLSSGAADAASFEQHPEQVAGHFPEQLPEESSPEPHDGQSCEPQDEADLAAENSDQAPDLDAPSGHSSGYPRDAGPMAGPERRGRVEPTLHDDDDHDDDAVPNERAANQRPGAGSDRHAAGHAGGAAPTRPESNVAPTLAMSDTPPPAPRRIERRKIIALRLAATSDRFAGQQLREALEAESLHHGKYSVFHRLHQDSSSIFSVASMVEPGTFDLEQMAAARYPGITLFAQLPGPLAGVQALHDLVACGKHLQSSLGGTLQDERGVPLTAHRVERLRQEIQDFEQAPGRDASHISGREATPPHP